MKGMKSSIWLCFWKNESKKWVSFCDYVEFMWCLIMGELYLIFGLWMVMVCFLRDFFWWWCGEFVGEMGGEDICVMIWLRLSWIVGGRNCLCMWFLLFCIIMCKEFIGFCLFVDCFRVEFFLLLLIIVVV